MTRLTGGGVRSAYIDISLDFEGSMSLGLLELRYVIRSSTYRMLL